MKPPPSKLKPLLPLLPLLPRRLPELPLPLKKPLLKNPLRLKPLEPLPKPLPPALVPLLALLPGDGHVPLQAMQLEVTQQQL